MIKSAIFSILGLGGIGGFLICDLCQPSSQELAAPTFVAGAETASAARC